LTKLRINLVCDRRYSNEQPAKIKVGQIVVQGMEYSDLQHPRFLYQHRGGVALLASLDGLDPTFMS
jgi:hypothetical protein